MIGVIKMGGLFGGVKSEEEKKSTLLACVSGKLVDLYNIDDEVFSTGVLGRGYGVNVSDLNLYSPADCAVKDVSNKDTTVTLKSSDGLLLMLHLCTKDGCEAAIELDESKEFGAGKLMGKIKTTGNAPLDKIFIAFVVTNSDELEEITINEVEATGGKTVGIEYLL